MKRYISLATIWFFLMPSLGLAQAEKRDAAVTPIAAIGEISDAEKSIIYTQLESVLSQYYRLISRAQYAEAEELAFEQLEAEECTEEQCIRAIQDILQVERLFALQIVREGEFSQISLTLVRQDDKIVRNTVCDDCSISELHQQVEDLVILVAQADADVEGLVAALPEPVSPPLAREEDDSGLPWWVWAIGGVVAVGVIVASTSSSSGGGGKSSTSSNGGGGGGEAGSGATGSIDFDY